MFCPISFKNPQAFCFTPLNEDLFSCSAEQTENHGTKLQVAHQGKREIIWVDKNELAQKLYLEESDLAAISENPLKLTQFLIRTQVLAIKIERILPQVDAFYAKRSQKPRFIHPKEIGSTAKRLARINIFDKSKQNDRLSAKKYNFPVTVCASHGKFYFNLRNSVFSKGSYRRVKLSISEDGDPVARNTGAIQRLENWKNERQALNRFNGQKGIIRTYATYTHFSRDKCRSTALQPLLPCNLLQAMNACRLNQRQKRQISSHILHAVNVISQEGMHRDIKPENILIRIFPDESVEIALIDFEFIVFHGDTSAGVSGTRNYVPPEVLSNPFKKAEMDGWAMGITLLMLHTGKAPPWFSMLTVPSQKKAITSAKFDLDQSKLDPKIFAILQGLLRLEPAQRISPKEALVIFHSDEKEQKMDDDGKDLSLKTSPSTPT
jgi:serine/threonine protein kinase